MGTKEASPNGCAGLFTRLYFYRCRLKPLDVQFMKRLHSRVNIVPVIAKSDALTIEERKAFKARVRNAFVYLVEE